VKVGNMVRMKYEMWWKLKSRKDFVSDVGVVIDKPSYNIVEVMLPGGRIKVDLAESWEIVA